MIKLLLAVLVASLTLNIILFSVYRTSVVQKEKVEQDYSLCASALESSNKRAEASENRCKVLDSVLNDYQKEAQIQTTALLSELEQLELIQTFQQQADRNREIANERNKVVASASDRLPDDLTRLLRESYNRNKGSVYSNPR